MFQADYTLWAVCTTVGFQRRYCMYFISSVNWRWSFKNNKTVVRGQYRWSLTIDQPLNVTAALNTCIYSTGKKVLQICFLIVKICPGLMVIMLFCIKCNIVSILIKFIAVLYIYIFTVKNLLGTVGYHNLDTITDWVCGRTSYRSDTLYSHLHTIWFYP